jgi:hypothetical protein
MLSPLKSSASAQYRKLLEAAFRTASEDLPGRTERLTLRPAEYELRQTKSHVSAR